MPKTTELAAQEMQVVISFELPRHEDRGTEMAMQGEVATRVYKVVEHLKEEFKNADIPAKIFSQVVTLRKPRTRRTKVQIAESKGNGAVSEQAPADAPQAPADMPDFLKRSLKDKAAETKTE